MMFLGKVRGGEGKANYYIGYNNVAFFTAPSERNPLSCVYYCYFMYQNNNPDRLFNKGRYNCNARTFFLKVTRGRKSDGKCQAQKPETSESAEARRKEGFKVP